MAAALPSTGCLFRSRTVEQRISTAPLQSATQQELIDAVNQQAEKIQSLQATVDIDTSVGGSKKGSITDYKEIRGFVLARKPAMLHLIGLMPIVRTRAFEMVSNGQDFKLWIPPKNRFVIGRNDVVNHNASNPLENIRPQNLYDALLIQRIDPEKEVAVLENSTEMVRDSKGRRMEQPDYELIVIRKGEQGAFLSRRIIISRTDLRPDRQIIYDEQGTLATDARYGDYKSYKEYDGISFPTKIEIVRPEEEYDITLHILKLQMNGPLKDDQFTLEQPAGADVVHLDQASGASQARAVEGRAP